MKEDFSKHAFLKDRLASGQQALGMFFLSSSSFLAEACGSTAIDWIVFDLEAGSVSRESLLGLMQSMRGSGIAALVRVPSHERHYIEHVLDLGAEGIIVPKVDTASQAEAIARASRFPPEGNRGLNPVRASGYFNDVGGYLSSVNARTLLLVQIESEEALQNVREILATPGVDGVFVGCGDLALSLGVPGEMTSPIMQDAIHTVLKATQECGKVPGIFAYTLELAALYLKQGFVFVAIGNEIKILKEGIRQSLEIVRIGASERK